MTLILAWLCNRCNHRHDGERHPGRCVRCRGVELRAALDPQRWIEF